tara:strand:+ start:2839 stop:3975 length:1137 start_codon:yes stop_codon:yes gene_type:complete
MKRSFIYALSTLVGSIIGVGLYSLPYITARVGIWVMLFYFLVLSLVSILIGLIYGEVILRTKGLHRLPGYAEKYLGLGAKRITFLVSGLGYAGATLAYLIVGGGFLASLFKPIFGGSYLIYVLIYFFLGAFLIYFGIKSIAQTEFLLLFLFFAILGFIFFRGFSLIDVNNLFAFDFKYLFLPYGAVLFSLSGASLIPEIKEMLTDNPKNLKKVIIWSVLISALTYLFFIFMILGISGQSASVNAITGLSGFLSNGIVSLALSFGILTTFTSFLTNGLTFKKMLWYDLKLKKNLAWLIACSVPLILFILGFNNFITVVSLVGGVLMGASLVMITLVYLKAKTKGDKKPAYNLSLPRILVYSLILFFILGIIYEIFYFIT